MASTSAVCVRSVLAAVFLCVALPAIAGGKTRAPSPTPPAPVLPLGDPGPQGALGGPLQCPPPPPPPSTEPAVCGDGKAQDVYERIVAPCIPGRCCQEGWVASGASEQCDGADLRGQSCGSLGFIGGAIQCTAQCRIDTSQCRYTASPEAHVEQLPDAPGCGSFHLPALGWDGTQLALAWPNSTAVAVAKYRLGTAGPAPAGGGSLALGGGYDQNALAEWASPHGPRTTVGTVMMAPLADGYVAAVQRFGDDTSTAVVRIRANGAVEGPLTTVPGPPLFLVAGRKGEALLGFEGESVGLVVISADAATIGKPAFPFPQKTSFRGQFAASAAASDDGWIVAAGNRELPGPIELARVSKAGSASAIARVTQQGTRPIIAGGIRPQLVYVQQDGVFAADASTGKSVRKLQSERAFQLIAAENTERGLTVWLEWKVTPSGTGPVSELHVDPDGTWSRRDVVAVPSTRACAALLDRGVLFLYLADENRRVPPRLFRSR